MSCTIPEKYETNLFRIKQYWYAKNDLQILKFSSLADQKKKIKIQLIDAICFCFCFKL